MSFSTHLAGGQTTTPRTIETQAGMAVHGQVVDAVGKAVDGASVKLKARDASTVFETISDASGNFIFKGVSVGAYRLTAEKLGVRSQAVDAVIAKGFPQNTVLVLGQASARQTQHEMEFADNPNFTVAGVTDWTAVGGHGSDATLRTSESLTRETLNLKAPATSESTSAKTGGTNDGTEERLRRALAAAPRSYTANHDLGRYYLNAAEYRQAVPLLQAALNINANHAEAEDEYALALACRGIGDGTKARTHLQKALALKDAAAYHRLAGQLDEDAGDPLSAVKELERAARLDGSEESFFAWGSELLLHRAVWEAAEVFGNGTKAHPGSARMKTGWGSALFAAALYDQAAQQLCQASDLAPGDTETYLAMGKIERASPAPLPCVEQRLERFRKLQPNNAGAAFLNAMMLAKRDAVQNRSAIERLLTETVRLEPKYAEAYLQLGILAFAQKKYADAIARYKQAIAADPRLGEAHYRLGVAYDRVGEPAKAKQELQLHDEIEKAQADAVEEERRRIKQFLVVQHGPAATSDKP